MTTDTNYSPWDQLPAPEPRNESPPIDHFYENTAKHLIKDTVRIMNNGLHINLERVAELEETLDKLLADVQDRLNKNPIISKFQQLEHARLIEEYKTDQLSKRRDISHYTKDFNHKDMNHRSYFMHIYTKQQNIVEPTELLPTGIPKWPANTVKKFAKTRPLLKKLLEGSLSPNNSIIKEAMLLFATHKTEMYNRSYEDNVKNPVVAIPDFSSGSSLQKRKLFTHLGLPSDKTSKTTGLPSYDRDEIERINKETADPDIKNLTHAMIDYSFGNIVRTNFVPAFYKYTVEGRLHGQYKLLGAKSGRYTSQKPNMLNTPSTRSIYSKPVKRCFTAPEGFIIAAIDYSALEDRVIASLSRDTNKCNIFLEGLDGHCLNAYGYFKEEIEAEMLLTGDTTSDVKEFFRLQENGNTTLKDIRQKGKPATFGLSYGSYPPKVAATLKIPLSDAEQIFNRYHNTLYPGITNYRENYVLPTTQQDGEIHLGLGFRIKSDNPSKDIRTLNNATCQFWSILTALAINKIHHLIDEAGYQDDIIVTSTIYDSIYFEVRNDPAIIKWLNDRIVPIMAQDFMENQTIVNEAELEIGPDWATLIGVPNEASLNTIQSVLDAHRIFDQLPSLLGRPLDKLESSIVRQHAATIITCTSIDEVLSIFKEHS